MSVLDLLSMFAGADPLGSKDDPDATPTDSISPQLKAADPELDDPIIKDIFYGKDKDWTGSVGHLDKDPSTNVPAPPPVVSDDEKDPNVNTPWLNETPKDISSDVLPPAASEAQGMPQAPQQASAPDLAPNFLQKLSAATNLKGDYATNLKGITEEKTGEYQTQQMNNPNSTVSKITQKALASILPGQDLSQLTAAQAQALAPGLITPLINMQGRQLMQQNIMNRQLGQGASADLNKVLSGTGELGQAKMALDNAKRAAAIIYNDPSDPSKGVKDLSNINLAEVAKAYDRMVSGGKSTVSGFEHLMPNTLQTKLAGWEQWTAGKPIPADAQEFVKMFADGIQREVGVNQKILYDGLKSATIPYQGLQKTDPSRWNDIQQGIEQYKPQQATGQAQPQQQQSTPGSSSAAPVGTTKTLPNGTVVKKIGPNQWVPA